MEDSRIAFFLKDKSFCQISGGPIQVSKKTEIWTIVILLVRVRLYWRESESERDIASRWVHREFNLMFTLNNDKDQRKNRFRSM